ncbi:MAG: chromosome segregation SMC family protein [Candidatus Pacearchaeota archaeon]
MVFIKKMVLNGFKSFASKTEIIFDKGINVIIGPNGAGKSNISDALCFVLGRLSTKSMRASKTSNLIFQGTKNHKPCHEAYVELVFDNSEDVFLTGTEEVIIKRIVRRDGTGIYKINNETKTRQEILEIMARSGIDPNGFNIILQGEIARFVKMHGNERREIIEEIAGISVYEIRKQKALSEIEKTEEKLKEVAAVLRERTLYLRNLEEERKQAIKFKELEKTIVICKASLIKKSIEEKIKEEKAILDEIKKDSSIKEKIKQEIERLNSEINAIELKINEINQQIQKTTGFERDELNDEITELNAKIAADSARKENFEKKRVENEHRKKELESELLNLKKEIQELREESPKISKRQIEIKKKKEELEKLSEDREKLNELANEVNIMKNRINDRTRYIEKIKEQSREIIIKINNLSLSIKFQNLKEYEDRIKEIKNLINESSKKIEGLNDKKIELIKEYSTLDSEHERYHKLKLQIPDKEICPLCHTKLTQEHITKVITQFNTKIYEIEKERISLNESITKINEEINQIKGFISKLENDLYSLQNEKANFLIVEEYKTKLKQLINEETEVKEEIKRLNDLIMKKESKIEDREEIEQKYQRLIFEIQEISSITDENIDSAILYKEREAENIENVIRSIIKSQKEISEEITKLDSELKNNRQKLEQREKELHSLNERFRKMFDERTNMQEVIKQKNILLINQQNALGRVDAVINNQKINLARVSAERESLEIEFKQFGEIKLIEGSRQIIEEKLNKCEQSLATIGSVNLRALETYDSVKAEYDKIAEKVAQLEKERDEILKIVHEIDIKKKKTFMKTFNSINELFTRNFSYLSSKGKAFLEIENQEEIFSGGVNITIKVAKGKYLDVTSLSGGEQTLVAIALIFAIQEYKPYHFYILDEIDAALDKRNSELLANLFKKYVHSGQYIIISHNDSIISEANVLYGVSMNQGISKIISLEINKK